MARIGASASNEARFCWEQVLRINPSFRVSSVFAPPRRAPQLLALYALFAALEETACRHEDHAIALRKLDWWRAEITAMAARPSDHPILRQLERTGALALIGAEPLVALVEHAVAGLDREPPHDVESLRPYCERISLPLLQVEWALEEGSGSLLGMGRGYAPVNGLIQLLRESHRQSPSRAFRWIPLALLARHGLARHEVLGHRNPARVRALFGEVLDAADTWGGIRTAADAPDSPPKARQRHLHVYAALQAQTLQQLRKVSPERYPRQLARVGPSRLYRAWTAARRFSRR